ncbi:MAG: hypothetical protein NTX21_11960 [Alphaproteobacteria bacterium]|nr:hypothetical protein [Alphaproteobacteria bacterium]
MPLAVVGKGWVVYFPFDLDRCFWGASNQDHLALLRNAVACAARDSQPLTVSGQGMVDVSYWRQKDSVTAHLVNLTNPMAMKGYMRELIAMGPYTVSLELPQGRTAKAVRLLETGTDAAIHIEDGRLIVKVPSVLAHEIVAVDLL